LLLRGNFRICQQKQLNLNVFSSTPSENLCDLLTKATQIKATQIACFVAAQRNISDFANKNSNQKQFKLIVFLFCRAAKDFAIWQQKQTKWWSQRSGK
jgi:hypothetical protein